MMINIVGTIWGSQGYAIHTRNLANAIAKITTTKLSTQLPMEWERQINDVELQMIKQEGQPDVNIIISQPNSWRMYCDAPINCGFLVWEGDKIPKSWGAECMNPQINYIFVPSTHTKEAILAVCPEAESKIHLMPHGVDNELFKPSQQGTEGSNVSDGHDMNSLPSLTPAFTFFANKGFRNIEDRGAIQYLLEAYLKEFTKKDNVKLLLKLNTAYPVADLKEICNGFGQDDNSAPIQAITQEMPYDQLPSLYQQSNVFVSPTRAEAFNIPCIEAMACGLPTISTNFGGQTDFVPKKWQIGGELVLLDQEIVYEETKWLTPNVDELRKMMREMYEKKDLTEESKEAREIALNYTWDATAKKIVDLLK